MFKSLVLEWWLNRHKPPDNLGQDLKVKPPPPPEEEELGEEHVAAMTASERRKFERQQKIEEAKKAAEVVADKKRKEKEGALEPGENDANTEIKRMKVKKKTTTRNDLDFLGFVQILSQVRMETARQANLWRMLQAAYNKNLHDKGGEGVDLNSSSTSSSVSSSVSGKQKGKISSGKQKNVPVSQNNPKSKDGSTVDEEKQKEEEKEKEEGSSSSSSTTATTTNEYAAEERLKQEIASAFKGEKSKKLGDMTDILNEEEEGSLDGEGDGKDEETADHEVELVASSSSSRKRLTEAELKVQSNKVLILLRSHTMHYPLCYCGCTIKFSN